MAHKKAARAPVEVSTDDAPDTAAPHESVAPETLAPRVEAVLFTLDRPITPGCLAEGLGLGAEDEPVRSVQASVDLLNEQYERTGRSFRIERVAGGLRVMTIPEQAESVAAFHAARAGGRLSRAAVETLAIVAYRQPITRVELEAIRGVACGEVLRTLLDRRLVAIVGRAEELGRPMLYGVSKRFLESFGLSSIKDLPPIGDLSSLVEPPPTRPREGAPTDRTAGESPEEANRAQDQADPTDAEGVEEATETTDEPRTDGD